MKATFELACHGLLVGQPVNDLAAWLNAKTPDGVHFNIVGDADPQPEAQQIVGQMVEANRNGSVPIFVGHSKGAMLAFYAADYLKELGVRSPLFVSIDSTCWGTNVPGEIEWAVVMSSNAGKWLVPDNVDAWLHFYQDSYPGGGQAQLAPNNATTALQIQHLPAENHLSIVNCDSVRQAILAAVLQATT